MGRLDHLTLCELCSRFPTFEVREEVGVSTVCVAPGTAVK
jgi:hypothetical protein